MCTYACPPGYQPSQWPKAQGSTKESIGGLFCNSDGYLELTRDSSKVLCEKGEGGVSIKNELSKVVATCRTVYPGTEAMVIPATANPGETVELCNPLQTEFMWDNLPTSAQYYVNKAGYSTEEACVWDSETDPEGAGNWSPMILGVGKAANGITYLSIFLNLPTSTAKLNFNIEIEGDITSECSYIDGKFSGGSSNGCTVSDSLSCSRYW
jgi:SUN family beta-glucosidase